MIEQTGADGKPITIPTGDDPYVIELNKITRWTDRQVVIDANVEHSTSGLAHHCVATRDESVAGGWRTRCREGSWHMH